MKKYLLPLAAAFVLSASAASAQTATTPAGGYAQRQGRQDNATPEERATRRSQRLSQELGLSADQTARIQQIMLSREQDMQSIRGQAPAAGSREQMGEQMKANRAKYDAQFKEVLTADQYTKYSQMEGGRQGRGKGQGYDNGTGPDKLKVKEGKVKAKDGKKAKLKAKTTTPQS